MTNDADKQVQVDLLPLLKMRSVRTILQWVAAILLGGSLTNTGEISRFVTGGTSRTVTDVHGDVVKVTAEVTAIKAEVSLAAETRARNQRELIDAIGRLERSVARGADATERFGNEFYEWKQFMRRAMEENQTGLLIPHFSDSLAERHSRIDPGFWHEFGIVGEANASEGE